MTATAAVRYRDRGGDRARREHDRGPLFFSRFTNRNNPHVKFQILPPACGYHQPQRDRLPLR